MIDPPPAGAAARPRLLVATTNPNKLEEIRRMLDGLGVAIDALPEASAVEAPEEEGATFEENARMKALYYARATGLLTVAEDSGLEIDALDGAPGVESARFGGPTYDEKFRAIYRRLAEVNAPQSAARFVCALALAWDGRVIFEARGTVEGRIAPEPRGSAGFGYDPIFYYPPYRRTLAEVSPAMKAAVSHRGQAFRALRRFLEERWEELARMVES